MTRFLLLLLLLLATSCKPPTPAALPVAIVPANSLQGKVVGCHDGDTIKVLLDVKQTTIRLEGIDAPELGQAFGKNAKQALSDFVFGKTVTLKPTPKPDRYGRIIARVFVDGQDVNLEMIRLGMAWHFVKYSKDDTLAAAESDARGSKRGLWYDATPLSPWDFRALGRK